EETLAAAHPIYFHRCERDDTDPDDAWLNEGALEADPGTPLAPEQPTQLVPPPLNLQDPHDLALHILGLNRDDRLPPVTPERLVNFHAYLCAHVRRGVPILVNRVGSDKPEDFKPGFVLRVMPLTPEMTEWDLLLEVMLLGEEEIQVPMHQVLP